GLATSRFAIARSQRPFRLSQSFRTICGRGYSGRTLAGETSLAQRVFSGPAAGCHFGSWHWAVTTKPIKREIMINVLLIGLLRGVGVGIDKSQSSCVLNGAIKQMPRQASQGRELPTGMSALQAEVTNRFFPVFSGVDLG